MARSVQIKNIGDVTYEEEYKGKVISIKPGKTITMQRRDGIKFLAQMSPNGKSGKPIEKKLAIVEESGSEPEKYISRFDGEEFDTLEELNAHLKKNNKKPVTRDEIDAITQKE